MDTVSFKNNRGIIMNRFFKDLHKYKNYTIYASKSDLKSEVAGSYLNWLWWILDPICFMLIYTLIFGVIFKAAELYFPIFIFIGLTMWNFFNRLMLSSIKIVKNNKAIVSKVYLPKHILLIEKMGVEAFKMGISFLIVIIMMIFYRVPVTWNVLCLVPILITFFVISFGFSTFLLHFGVFVQDLRNVVQIGLRLVFYMTGIFYNLETRIPAPYSDYLEKLNPVAFLMTSMRKALLYQETVDWLWLGIWFVVGILICMLGIHTIYKNENSYVKVI